MFQSQVQKLSNLLQKCKYVQISINYFHKTATGAVLFTGLPPFNLKERERTKTGTYETRGQQEPVTVGREKED